MVKYHFAFLSALKVHSELAFVAGITRIVLTEDMTSGMSDQIFLFVLRKSTTLCNVLPPSTLLKL